MATKQKQAFVTKGILPGILVTTPSDEVFTEPEVSPEDLNKAEKERFQRKSVYEKIFMDEILPPSLQAVAKYDIPLSEITSEKTKLRGDFYIVWKIRKVLFEIDGHRSHYIDPVQLERDERKDKLCEKHGITIIRLTGRFFESRKGKSDLKKLVKREVFKKPYPDQQTEELISSMEE